MARNPVNVQDVNSGFDSQIMNNRATRVSATAVPMISRRRSETLHQLNRAYRFVDVDTELSNAMNVDGSVSAVEFTIPRVQDRQLNFTHIRMVIESGNDLDIDSSQRKQFGSAGLLANGIEFTIFLGGARGTFDLFPFPVTKVEDLLLFANPGSVINLLQQGPTAPDQLIVEISHGADLILAHIGGSDRMRVIINDDLTSLDRFEMVAFGHENFR